MDRMMRKAPFFAVIVALVIQAGRVTDFGERLNAGMLALVFALFLGGSVFVLSYWSERARYEVTADPADKAKHAQQLRMKRLHDDVARAVWTWLVLFLLIDGGLNLAETWLSLPPAADLVLRAGAVAYGVFPTLAALGLGRLQSSLDRLPAPPTRKSPLSSLFDAWMRRMERSAAQDAPETRTDAAQDAKSSRTDAKNAPHTDAYPKACPHGCGASLKNAAQFSAHVGRWCPNKPIAVDPSLLIDANKLSTEEK